MNRILIFAEELKSFTTMKNNMIQDIDYNELLQQTVAVIEKARTNVARHLAVTASNTAV